MAVAFVRNLPNQVSSKTAGTSAGMNPGVTPIPAGSLLVAESVFDNAAVASKPVISSIGKPAGETNNWVFLGAARSTSTSAGAFASGEMWAIKTTVDWTDATTITFTWDTSITMKAANISVFTGAEAVLRSTVGTAYSTTTTQANATTSGTVPVTGDLAVGFLFGSNVAAAQAGDTDTIAGNWSTPVGVGSTGGSGATNNFGIYQYKILTSGGAPAHQTYSNGLGMTAGNGVIVAILQASIEPAVTQAAYRFYADGTEAGSTALAAQNTAYTADLTSGDANMQVRVRLQETAGGVVPATDDWQLQWEKNTSGTWVNVIAAVAEHLADTYEDTFVTYLVDGSSPAKAQSFLGNGENLSRAGFWLNKSTGTPDGTVTARLYAHTGTYGTNGLPTGSPLATSTTVITCSTVSTTATWVEFEFDGTVPLTNGTPYCIALWSTITTTTTGNRLLVGLDDTSSTHSGTGAAWNGSTWTSAFADVGFRVYTRVGGTVVPYASPTLDNTAPSTNRLGAGTGSFVAGDVTEDGVANDQGWSASNYTEHVYSVTLKQADLTNGDTLRFRVLRNGATTSMTYTQYPTINVTMGAGLTPITITRPTTWNVKGQPTITRSTTWDVLTPVTKVLSSTTWDTRYAVAKALSSTTWKVRQAVTLTRSTTWNVAGAAVPVEVTRSTTWDTRFAVGLTRAVSWDAALAVVKTLGQTTWRTRQAIALVRPTTWDVTTPVTKTLGQTTWKIRQAVTLTRVATWDATFPVTVVRSTTWDTVKAVVQVRSTTWDTGKAVTFTRATTWDVTIPVVLTRLTTWNIFSVPTIVRSTTWNVAGALVQVTVTRAVSWRTLQVVGGTPLPTYVDWHLDGNALDSSGNGLDGALSGGATFAAGIKGQGVSFPTPGAVRGLPPVAFDDFTARVAWRTATPTAAVIRSLICMRGPTGELENVFQWRHEGGTLWRMVLWNTAGSAQVFDFGMVGGNAIAANTWYVTHVVKQGANLTIYFDGVQKYTSAAAPVLIRDPGVGTRVVVGSSYSTTEPWSGLVDEVAIFPPMTLAEVQADLAYVLGTLPGVSRSTTWDTLEAVGSTTVHVTDSFNRADNANLGTADTGQPWVNLHGAYGISGNRALATTTGSPFTLAGIARVHTDIEVSTVLGAMGGIGLGQRIGVFARYLASNMYYYVYADNDRAILTKRTPTGDFQLASKGSGMTAGQTLGIRCQGSTISMLVNGVVTNSATDTDFASGTQVGLWANASGGTQRWDDFRVTGVPLTRPTTWDATFPVTIVRSTTWKTRAPVTVVRSATWDVTQAVTLSRLSTWNIRALVGPTRSTTWDALSSRTLTRSTTWDTTATVSVTRATTWDATGTVVRVRSTTWNVAEPTLGTVNVTRSTTWRTKAILSVPRAVTWDVLTPVTVLVRSTTWDVTSTRTVARATTWDTRLTVTTPRSTTWRQRSLVTVVRSTTWRAEQAVVFTRSTTWDVTTPVVRTRGSTWNIRSQVVQVRSTSWNVAGFLGQVTVVRSTTWKTRAAVTAVKSTTWDARVQIVVVKSVLWDARLAVVTVRSTTWRTTRAVVQVRFTTWKTIAAVTVVRSAIWDSREWVLLVLSTTWNVKGQGQAPVLEDPGASIVVPGVRAHLLVPSAGATIVVSRTSAQVVESAEAQVERDLIGATV